MRCSQARSPTVSRESRVSQDQRGSSLGEREEEDERGTRTTPEERRHAKLAQPQGENGLNRRWTKL